MIKNLYGLTYNAIERYWAWLDKSWNGYLLSTVDTVINRDGKFGGVSRWLHFRLLKIYWTKSMTWRNQNFFYIVIRNQQVSSSWCAECLKWSHVDIQGRAVYAIHAKVVKTRSVTPADVEFLRLFHSYHHFWRIMFSAVCQHETPPVAKAASNRHNQPATHPVLALEPQVNGLQINL